MEHLVRRSITTMYRSYHEPLTLDDLARSAMVSKFHFLRVFTRVTGVTPGRFLSAVRLHEAKRLLRTTSLNVADISAQVGYSSTGTFSRRFSESVGVSPTKYRHLAYERCTGQPVTAGTPGPFGLRKHPGPTRTTTALLPVRRAPRERATTEGHAQSQHRHSSTIHGLITVEGAPLPAAFIGLFNSPILQGRPVTATSVRAPGRFHLADIPAGEWYLHALSPASGRTPGLAAVPGLAATSPYDAGALLVGMVGPIRVAQTMDIHINMALRPFDWSRPPILSALMDMAPLDLSPEQAA
ncbi:helix-turn-helix transcriptional regulator [Streptomyces sp. NPDC056486]|uniref:helix-turn-helix transcriptional regulator n=1 Tax=Streptomyces sp. NPDC056486 TaxID=3345835 RepID=UPI0036CAC619